MQSVRMPSTDIATQLHRLDSRLAELRGSEDDYNKSGGLSIQQSAPGSPVSCHDSHVDPDASTLNPNSMMPSGCSTPWEQHSHSTFPQRPRLRSHGQSSMIQIKKEEKKTWYQYPRKGYKTTTKYFYQEIDSSWTVISLVACFFVSGLVDSIAFSVWGVFVAMQTGNTIFLALRISGQPITHHPLNFIKCLTSIICYCSGALVFNCLHRAPTGLSDPSAPLHRWTLLFSFAIQSGLLLIAAILAQTSIISTNSHRGGTFSSGSMLASGDNYLDLIGIGLLAFEAAGQVCLSRVLLVNELPTIVLSTLYHDLIGEALGLRKSWRESATWWDFLVAQKKQIRRFACIVALFSGALTSGFVFASQGGLAAGLWLAGGIKVCISLAWCLWKKKVVTETVVTREPRSNNM